MEGSIPLTVIPRGYEDITDWETPLYIDFTQLVLLFLAYLPCFILPAYRAMDFQTFRKNEENTNPIPFACDEEVSSFHSSPSPATNRARRYKKKVRKFAHFGESVKDVPCQETRRRVKRKEKNKGDKMNFLICNSRKWRDRWYFIFGLILVIHYILTQPFTNMYLIAAYINNRHTIYDNTTYDRIHLMVKKDKEGGITGGLLFEKFDNNSINCYEKKDAICIVNHNDNNKNVYILDSENGGKFPVPIIYNDTSTLEYNKKYVDVFTNITMIGSCDNNNSSYYFDYYYMGFVNPFEYKNIFGELSDYRRFNYRYPAALFLFKSMYHDVFFWPNAHPGKSMSFSVWYYFKYCARIYDENETNTINLLNKEKYDYGYYRFLKMRGTYILLLSVISYLACWIIGLKYPRDTFARRNKIQLIAEVYALCLVFLFF